LKVNSGYLIELGVFLKFRCFIDKAKKSMLHPVISTGPMHRISKKRQRLRNANKKSESNALNWIKI